MDQNAGIIVGDNRVGECGVGGQVVVMGLGRFGGGVGAARYLAEQGWRVLVTDRDDATTLRDSIEQLSDCAGIDYRLGEHRVEDFASADLVVANPAIKPEGNVYLEAARSAGVPIVTEIQLLTRRLNRQRVIGITGSAGKSTVTAMVGHILEACELKTTSEKLKVEGRAKPQAAETQDSQSRGGNVGGDVGGDVGGNVGGVWVGGNLGGSLLGRLDEIDGARDWVVLELSSFMLHYLREDGWSPRIAVLTNLSANHLDWHGTFENYAQDKRAIFAFQDRADGDIAIDGTEPGLSWRDEDLSAIELLTPGVHNRVNARLAAMVVESAIGLSAKRCYELLGDFAGLPHRLQLVCEHEDVRYYNDSKSTTPEAAMLAIDAFEVGTVHAIVGGYDKGSDLTGLAQHAAKRCRAVYCIGATGDAIAEAVRDTLGAQALAKVWGGKDATVEQAVAASNAQRRRGDVVVLSPGCASWDQFTNYEARGAAFVGAVLRATSEGCAMPKAVDC